MTVADHLLLPTRAIGTLRCRHNRGRYHGCDPCGAPKRRWPRCRRFGWTRPRPSQHCRVDRRADVGDGRSTPRSISVTIGEEEAGRRWRSVYRAVRRLAERIHRLEIDCDRGDRQTLTLQVARSLPKAEGRCALHSQFDLPSAFFWRQTCMGAWHCAQVWPLSAVSAHGPDPPMQNRRRRPLWSSW